MGFDLFIHLKLTMCENTGKPYYFDKSLVKKYDYPEINIPEELRKYLYGRGHFFHAYVDPIEDQDIGFEVDVCEFLDSFPDWKEVTEHDRYDDYWTEEDHNNFKALLECLESLPYPFSVSWSY